MWAHETRVRRCHDVEPHGRLWLARRPPVAGRHCTGRRTYSLNHWALSWDTTGLSFVGPTHITEVVTVSADGDAYKGTFQITQYDPTGTTSQGGPSGIVVATRIDP
jgi:hypothetical protein